MNTISVYQVKLQKVGDVSFEWRPIHAPKDAVSIFQTYLEHYCHTDRENFIAMYLNVKNEVVGLSTVHIGSLNASLVNPREVYTDAVLHKAASVILCHNHPSGNPSPSREDIEVTKTLRQAGEILDIAVLDHIIIGQDRFISFKEQGYMNNTQAMGGFVWENRVVKETVRFRNTEGMER
ncbi:DNA repair protein RadC [Brevibacillus humidisoli]|uniref:JAB domain-containing protein n=1 Tax=Brevibacillus humidisoli TaxID=2895522 RepID=UPI001E483A73|nr:DNA repair protein RadC [Brevibacillus humidisoli]UFJ41340.1 DNA repair protein RadC [Brevibacillus humidisoli]